MMKIAAYRGWTSLVSVLWLMACSSSSQLPIRDEEVAALPAHRARLVGNAIQEWQSWGRITLHGWPNLRESEPDPAMFDKILAYWTSVPGEGPAIIRRHQALRDALAESQDVAGAASASASISLWAWPAWSAAFISHQMAASGVPSFVFPPSASHAAYVDVLLAEVQQTGTAAAFAAHHPADYVPRPGDLLCSDRSLYPLLHWQDRIADAGQFRPMHCDIVVAARGGTVHVIGGNVLDVVALRIFPADDAGRVLPAPWDKPPFFLVLENRLDEVP
ncbi:DUF2272 domain-containing protein [Pseudoroseomonas globiformis]|uniref:DUF2272 domain-containing protein n=1 Tax=Teichococcus globiformis TaxID=2307229 RepID=A0ABV7G1A6_9PROT